MKPATICIALALVLAPCSFSGQAASRPKQSEIDSANRLFQAGKFAEAGKLYSHLAAQNPKDYSSTLQLGRIALLSNRLDDAQKWLRKAIPCSRVTPTPGSCWPRYITAATISPGPSLRCAASR
jgi:predicted Zn-dependent protease